MPLKRNCQSKTSPADAHILFFRAIEVIPIFVELWLALACLEMPKNTKVVLNKVHKVVLTLHEIWITAGQLIEQEAYMVEL